MAQVDNLNSSAAREKAILEESVKRIVDHETGAKNAVSITEAHNALLRFLTQHDVTKNVEDWIINIFESRFARLVKALIQRSDSANLEFRHEAISSLSHVLEMSFAMSPLLNQEETDYVIKNLCSKVKSDKTEERQMMCACLVSLSRSNFHLSSLRSKVRDILDSVNVFNNNLKNDDLNKQLFYNAATGVFLSLLQKFPDEMFKAHVLWFPLVLRAATYVPANATGISEAQKAARDILSIVAKHAEQEHFEVPDQAKEEIKHSIAPDIQKLCRDRASSYEFAMYGLDIWEYLVSLLGKALHQRVGTLNALLKCLEFSFRPNVDRVRERSFKAWRSIINNFALDPSIIGQGKRLVLLLQPLKGVIVTTQPAAVAKFSCWWHLICQLDAANCLVSFTEDVCIAFLRFCYGGTVVLEKNANKTSGAKGIYVCPSDPNSPKLSLNDAKFADMIVGGTLPAFANVQASLDEVIFNFLGTTDALQDSHIRKLQNKPLASGRPLSVDIFHVLLQSIRMWSVVSNADSNSDIANSPVRSKLLRVFSLWEAAASCLISGTMTPELCELFIVQLRAFVDETNLNTHACLNLCAVIAGKLCGHMERRSPFGSGSVPETCFAVFLMTLLPPLTEENAPNSVRSNLSTSDFSLVLTERLVTSLFLEEEKMILPCFCDFFNLFTLRMATCMSPMQQLNAWIKMAERVAENLKQVTKATDVPKHDVHVWHKFLAFPASTSALLGAKEWLSVKNAVMTPWKELFDQVLRCSALALSTTYDNNEVLEELAKVVLTLDFTKIALVCFSLEIFTLCTNAADVTKLNLSNAFDVSPSKKSLTTLGRLTYVVMFGARAISAWIDFAPQAEVDSEMVDLLRPYSPKIVEAVHHLFTIIKSPSAMYSLVEVMCGAFARFLCASAGPDRGDLFRTCGPKLENCVTSICQQLSSVYHGPYDSQLLKHLESFVIACLDHKRKALRDRMLQFWQSTFARSSRLEYSDNLKGVLQRVKVKTSLVCPGLDPPTVSVDNVSATDTIPVVDAALVDQQECNVPVIGDKSPRKKFGSLLNCQSPATPRKTDDLYINGLPASPQAAQASAAHTTPSQQRAAPVSSTTVQNLHTRLDDMDVEDFVPIVPSKSPKQRSILITEHQKDVFEEQRRTRLGISPLIEQTLDSQDLLLPTVYNTGNGDVITVGSINGHHETASQLEDSATQARHVQPASLVSMSDSGLLQSSAIALTTTTGTPVATKSKRKSSAIHASNPTSPGKHKQQTDRTANASSSTDTPQHRYHMFDNAPSSVGVKGTVIHTPVTGTVTAPNKELSSHVSDERRRSRGRARYSVDSDSAHTSATISAKRHTRKAQLSSDVQPAHELLEGCGHSDQASVASAHHFDVNLQGNSSFNLPVLPDEKEMLLLMRTCEYSLSTADQRGADADDGGKFVDHREGHSVKLKATATRADTTPTKRHSIDSGQRAVTPRGHQIDQNGDAMSDRVVEGMPLTRRGRSRVSAGETSIRVSPRGKTIPEDTNQAALSSQSPQSRHTDGREDAAVEEQRYSPELNSGQSAVPAPAPAVSPDKDVVLSSASTSFRPADIFIAPNATPSASILKRGRKRKASAMNDEADGEEAAQQAATESDSSASPDSPKRKQRKVVHFAPGVPQESDAATHSEISLRRKQRKLSSRRSLNSLVDKTSMAANGFVDVSPSLGLSRGSFSPRAQRMVDVAGHGTAGRQKTPMRSDAPPAPMLPLPSSPSRVAALAPSSVEPVYASLMHSAVPVDAIVPLLATAEHQSMLARQLQEMNVTTIGALASLSSEHVNQLGVKQPKISSTIKALQSLEGAVESGDVMDTAELGGSMGTLADEQAATMAAAQATDGQAIVGHLLPDATPAAGRVAITRGLDMSRQEYTRHPSGAATEPVGAEGPEENLLDESKRTLEQLVAAWRNPERARAAYSAHDFRSRAMDLIKHCHAVQSRLWDGME